MWKVESAAARALVISLCMLAQQVLAADIALTATAASNAVNVMASGATSGLAPIAASSATSSLAPGAASRPTGAVQSNADGSAIPFRQDQPASPLQLGLAYASTLVLLAALALGLFMLRKRLAARLPQLLSTRSSLQCVSSLRLPMRTSVHVVSWRGREVMFAQSGDSLQLLGEFQAGAQAEEGRS